MGRRPKAHNLRPERYPTVIPVLCLMIQRDLNRHSLLASRIRRTVLGQDGAPALATEVTIISIY
jgi:hypothetical protein